MKNCIELSVRMRERIITAAAAAILTTVATTCANTTHTDVNKKKMKIGCMHKGLEHKERYYESNTIKLTNV